MKEVVIGFDPSPKHTGWSMGIGKVGVIRASSVLKMAKAIIEKIKEVQPTCVGMEDFVDQGKKIRKPIETARDMGKILGIVQHFCESKGILFKAYQSGETKANMDYYKRQFAKDPGDHKFSAYCVYHCTRSWLKLESRIISEIPMTGRKG